MCDIYIYKIGRGEAENVCFSDASEPFWNGRVVLDHKLACIKEHGKLQCRERRGGGYAPNIGEMVYGLR